MRRLLVVVSLTVALGSAVAAQAAVAAPGLTWPGFGFNRPGDLLIADQFNNRVIEINRNHQIVWSFGDGSSVAGPHSIVGPNDAERVGPSHPDRRHRRAAGAVGDGARLRGQRLRRQPRHPRGPVRHIVWQYGAAASPALGPTSSTRRVRRAPAHGARADHRPGQLARHRGQRPTSRSSGSTARPAHPVPGPTSSTTPTAPSCWPTATS